LEQLSSNVVIDSKRMLRDWIIRGLFEDLELRRVLKRWSGEEEEEMMLGRLRWRMFWEREGCIKGE
jgi:hypothetical protein